MPTTTRPTPASTSASAHGAVRPWWRAGLERRRRGWRRGPRRRRRPGPRPRRGGRPGGSVAPSKTRPSARSTRRSRPTGWARWTAHAGGEGHRPPHRRRSSTSLPSGPACPAGATPRVPSGLSTVGPGFHRIGPTAERRVRRLTAGRDLHPPHGGVAAGSVQSRPRSRDGRSSAGAESVGGRPVRRGGRGRGARRRARRRGTRPHPREPGVLSTSAGADGAGHAAGQAAERVDQAHGLGQARGLPLEHRRGCPRA